MGEEEEGEDEPRRTPFQAGMVYTTVAVEPPIKVFHPPQGESACVRYDVCLDEVVVVQGRNVQISSLFTGQRGSVANNDTVNANFPTNVLAAKRSLGKSWLGVLKSEKELVFYRSSRDGESLSFKAAASYTCKQSFQLAGLMGGSKRLNLVMDFFWLADNVVVILTSSAIETFLLERNTLQRLRHYATPIDYYVFNSRHRVLLCVSREKPGLLKTYKIGQTSGINRFSKISVSDSTAREFAANESLPLFSLSRRSMPRYNLRVVRLYGKTCLLHITVHQEMHLYTLASKANTWEKTSTFALPQRDIYTVNIVDNLIMVHLVNAKTTVVFDHRLGAEPIVPPQQLGLSFSGNASRLYDANSIVPVHPDKLLDLVSGAVYALVFDVQVAVPKFAGNLVVLEFLLQRRLSKQEVLAHLRKSCLDDRVLLSEFAGMFDAITAAMAKGMEEDGGNARLTSGFLVARQSNSSFNPSFCIDTRSSPSPESLAHGRPSASPSGSESVSSPTQLGRDGKDSDSEVPDAPLASYRMLAPPSGAAAALQADAAPSDSVTKVFENTSMHRLNETGTTVPYPYYSSQGEWYTMAHTLVIDQVDMYNDVFERVRELNCRQANPITHTRFRALFLEYTRSLTMHSIKLKNVLQEFLIDLLAKSDPPGYPKLHYYLQYRVIEDSIPIALYLMKFEDRYAPAFQLGLDMLGRLKAHHEMVNVLLAKGQLVRAVEIMIDCRVRDVDVAYILKKACEVSDPMVMNSLRVLLKRYNKRVRDIDGFAAKDKAQAFERLTGGSPM